MLDSFIIQSLIQIVGPDHVLTDPDDLDCYSADALTPFRAFGVEHALDRLADVVVRPGSTSEVSGIVALASQRRIPVVPYGGGTGVMGGTLPIRGGIVVDLKRLDRIPAINSTDLTVEVQAGVVLQQLEEALAEHGLRLGHDPYSFPIATVGGAISTNGVGYRASAFGPMGEQVLALEAVLPDGRILTTRAVPKYSSGPNLNQLFIGSEGVFGIITGATLRSSRVPEAQAFATASFNSFEQGFKAAAEILAMGIRPTLLDLTEETGHIRLYMLFEGYQEGVAAQQGRAVQLCGESGGRDIGPKPTEGYWQDRHQSGETYQRNALGKPRRVRWNTWRGRGFDYLHLALPISQVLEYRRRSQEIMAGSGVKVVEYSIWSRPELFSMLLAPDSLFPPSVSPGLPSAGAYVSTSSLSEDPSLSPLGKGGHRGVADDAYRESLSRVVEEVLTLAQDMGGVMEYCHGVGIKLGHLLAREMGVGHDVVRAMKQALDPANIMNPGKLGL